MTVGKIKTHKFEKNADLNQMTRYKCKFSVELRIDR